MSDDGKDGEMNAEMMDFLREQQRERNGEDLTNLPFCDRLPFNMAIGVVIVLNAIVIGIETDAT